ncbi:MAG: type I pullulanase [Bacteroidales bacterium]|jgi:pullulanase|nr:type I pullulanase [Bacteroidales bacterium]
MNEVIYTREATHFEIWAPTAEAVLLRIYDAGIEGNLLETELLVRTTSPRRRDVEGYWQISLNGDYEGKFYTFEVRIGEQWYGETPGIFAKAVGVNGLRGAIIDFEKTNPEGWKNDKRPALKDFSDITIYEVHHREFSISPNSGMQNKGKFLSWTERGTTNDDGLSTGIDHLVDLGITHVHLLPSFDFATIDETKLDIPQFNWGYDPLNYNVPEGSYSTDPHNPYSRILEFKKMVQSLHRSGIRVIMDVVYNHVYSIPDSPFERTVPGYFFRKKDGEYANGSGCFSETASEREMMRKFMVESVVYWATEYHIDGFRFDLMGIHDIETMNAIRKALNKIDPTIFMYGEGWSAELPQLPFEDLAMKSNIAKLNGIAAFSDEFRDGLRGNWFNNKVGGFAVGVPNSEESLKFGLVGGIEHPQIDYGKINYDPKRAWALKPTQFISYVSCHDDMCLVDKLKFTTPNDTTIEQVLKYHKLAHTAVFLSQGVPFMYAGEEIFRDKKGVSNTYKSPDSINLINWANKTQYFPLFNYYKKLIALRKAHPAFRMGDADLIRKHLNFLSVQYSNVIAYELTNHANDDTWSDIVVALNGNLDDVIVEIPQGMYTAVLHNGLINLNGLGRFQGGQVKISGSSALVMWKKSEPRFS